MFTSIILINVATFRISYTALTLLFLKVTKDTIEPRFRTHVPDVLPKFTIIIIKHSQTGNNVVIYSQKNPTNMRGFINGTNL